MNLIQADGYRERWNSICSRHFEKALSLGLADSLQGYLREFHPLEELDLSGVLALHNNGNRQFGESTILIPRDAPPFLTIQHPDLLLRPFDRWPRSRQIDARFHVNLFLLYQDGEGNPICIDSSTPEGAVVWLDHEDLSRSAQLVNSSVLLFCEALLFASAVKAGAASGSDLLQLDPPARHQGCFWPEAVSSLR